MKKLKSKAGLTLMEMMTALLILVLLVVGMGTGMDAGMRVYRDSMFETDSASLAGILNTAMGDLLRYAQDIERTDAAGDNVDFVFTNVEYGVVDGYFYTPVQTDGSSAGTVQLKNLRNDTAIDLVNAGAYPNLMITNLKVTYVSPTAIGGDILLHDNTVVKSSRGGFFYVTYDVLSTVDAAKSREIKTVVRQMNTE